MLVWSEEKKNKLKIAKRKKLEDPPSNRNMRFGAYYGMSLFLNGHSKRKPLPACLMKNIRETFPDNNGAYQGFLWGKK